MQLTLQMQGVHVDFQISRLLVPTVLSIAAVSATMLSAQSEDHETLFLEGLRERAYYDTAESEVVGCS